MRMDIAQFTDGAREKLRTQAEQYRHAKLSVDDKDRAELLASWLHAQGEFALPVPPRRRLRFAVITFRAFWRSLWRSIGWCIPIVIAIEWVASRHPHA